MKHVSEYEKALHEEIEKRLEEMEKPDFEFPQRFSKRDYLITAVVAVVCLVILIIGAYI